MFALRHIGTDTLCGFTVELHFSSAPLASVAYNVEDCGSTTDNVWVVNDYTVAEREAAIGNVILGAHLDPSIIFVGHLEVVELRVDNNQE